VPSLRKKIAQYVLEKHLIQASGVFQEKTAKANVLEGEFHKEE